MPQTAFPDSVTTFKSYMAKTTKQWCRTQPNASYNSGAEPNEITSEDIPQSAFGPGRNLGHHYIQKNQRNTGGFVFKALILFLPIQKTFKIDIMLYLEHWESGIYGAGMI